jgi:uncharacterized protein YecE (DUF72 family)
MATIKLGTCSWNYDSWIGLVYSHKRGRAAEYLEEYTEKYSTAEIDSWFYKIPDPGEVQDYLDRTGDDFRFTCKVSREITLTHLRNRDGAGGSSLIPNPDFLSAELFGRYLDAIREMLPRLDAVMLEFEYLNRQKMASVQQFTGHLAGFLEKVDRSIPLAIETRNKNYLTEDYFKFLDEKRLIHVFSEKIYMPPVYEVYRQFRSSINTDIVIRLLGGDRAEIEKKTGEKWNRIVEERNDKEKIVDMAMDAVQRGLKVTINVNNHYEGSAPLTIAAFRELFASRGVAE